MQEVIKRSYAKSLGLIHYFTGKPCKHGHISKRTVGDGRCCQCGKDRDRSEYLNRNKARISLREKEYREKHKEHRKSLLKNWYEKTKLDEVPYHTKWRLSNKDDPEFRFKKVQNETRRRARKKNAIPKWEDAKKTREFYRNRPKGMHVDHMVPLVSDFVCGLHWHGNLQYLTISENSSKRNLWWPDMWE